MKQRASTEKEDKEEIYSGTPEFQGVPGSPLQAKSSCYMPAGRNEDAEGGDLEGSEGGYDGVDQRRPGRTRIRV